MSTDDLAEQLDRLVARQHIELNMEAPASAVSHVLLVTITAVPAVPGVRAWTWAGVAASSATSRTLRPAKRERSSAVRSPVVSGMAKGGTPRARNISPSVSPESRGRGDAPASCTYSWPSGNESRMEWAAWSARDVLPTPGNPQIAAIGTKVLPSVGVSSLISSVV